LIEKGIRIIGLLTRDANESIFVALLGLIRRVNASLADSLPSNLRFYPTA
jgi:hypothetical protein